MVLPLRRMAMMVAPVLFQKCTEAMVCPTSGQPSSKLEGSQRIEVVEAVVGIQQDVDVFLQAAVELLLLEHQPVDVVFDGVQ